MPVNIHQVINNIEKSSLMFSNHLSYPTNPGIYAFKLTENSSLKKFGSGGHIIYVGIAKDSLKNRDLNNHFKDKRTGWSTLRRSIGAVLKDDLALDAHSRNGTTDSRAISHYIFQKEGERRLSNWMKNNLEVGYWEDTNNIDYKLLRDLEMEVTKNLKPTLDLDRRTRRFNPFADELDRLRKVCKEEAFKNASESSF